MIIAATPSLVLIPSDLQGDADGALDRLWQQKRAEIKQ
jgi:hypothetical protein